MWQPPLWSLLHLVANIGIYDCMRWSRDPQSACSCARLRRWQAPLFCLFPGIRCSNCFVSLWKTNFHKLCGVPEHKGTSLDGQERYPFARSYTFSFSGEVSAHHVEDNGHKSCSCKQGIVRNREPMEECCVSFVFAYGLITIKEGRQSGTFLCRTRTKNTITLFQWWIVSGSENMEKPQPQAELFYECAVCYRSTWAAYFTSFVETNTNNGACYQCWERQIFILRQWKNTFHRNNLPWNKTKIRKKDKYLIERDIAPFFYETNTFRATRHNCQTQRRLGTVHKIISGIDATAVLQCELKLATLVPFWLWNREQTSEGFNLVQLGNYFLLQQGRLSASRPRGHARVGGGGFLWRVVTHKNAAPLSAPRPQNIEHSFTGKCKSRYLTNLHNLLQ